MLCVCVTSHRIVKYVRIMRWWSPNIGQWHLGNLGPDAMIRNLFNPYRLTCLSRFWIVIGPLLHPNPPQSVAVCCQCPSISHPPPTSYPGAVKRPPLLVSAPLAACLRLLLYAWPPPRFHTWPAPRSLSAPRGSPVTGNSASLCPCPPLPLCAPLPGIIWFLVSILRCPFWARERGQGAYTPCQSINLASTPPTTWPRRHHRATYPPPLHTFFSSWSHPLGRSLWGVALEGGVTCTFGCHGRGKLVRKTEGQILCYIFHVVFLCYIFRVVFLWYTFCVIFLCYIFSVWDFRFIFFVLHFCVIF